MSAVAKHLRFGLALAALAVVLTWLVIGEHSPLDGSSRAPAYYLALLINLPGMLVGIVGSGLAFKSTDPIFFAGIALQWMFIGAAVSWLWSWRRSRSGSTVVNEGIERDA